MRLFTEGGRPLASERGGRSATEEEVVKVAALLLGLTLAGAPGVARADDQLHDPLARELKAAGDQAMGSLRYDEALTDYERATAIESHPILLFNRARALQALHRYAEALEHFEEFRRQASPELLARAGELDQLIERLRQQVSTLTVVCNVAGATVLVRGVKVGTTPLSGPLRLNAGTAAVSLVADGQKPYEHEVVLPGGGAERLEVRLEARKAPGRVVVRSPIAGALVYIDGNALGVVPAEAALPAGRHRVRLEHPDYRRVETTLEIVDGERKVMNLELERRPGLLQKWWFWTGCAVIVAGGAAVVVAVTTERSPDRGDIAPGVVSAPLTRF